MQLQMLHNKAEDLLRHLEIFFVIIQLSFIKCSETTPVCNEHFVHVIHRVHFAHATGYTSRTLLSWPAYISLMFRTDQIVRYEAKTISPGFLYWRLSSQLWLVFWFFKGFEAKRTQLAEEIVARRRDEHVKDAPPLLFSFVVAHQKNDHIKEADKGPTSCRIGLGKS